jgi:NAD(P)-dependent dehydrogenase (short-subunit alcohol dehydrogenase family)
MSEGNGNGIACGTGSGSLKGRVALVTGGARGIGRAIVLELAGRGAAVAVNYHSSRAEAESLAARVGEMGVGCLLAQGDVAEREQARSVVGQVMEACGRLDILVNNAGISRNKSLRKMADDDWADVINVNLNGTYYCTSAALPHMIRQKFGRIINITSYSGQAGNFGQANYAASKGGIAAFTKTVALEMAKYNITANAIAPGFTSTEMLAGMPPEIQEQIKGKIPMGRFGEPEEIARAAGFLAADADYITGQQLSVNGGICMM